MGLDEKSLIRKDAKKSSKKKWYIGAAVLCAVIAIGNIGQFIVDNTIGRFPDIYQAIDFNNDFEQEDILDIIYGDTTAMVLYEMVAGNDPETAYQRIEAIFKKIGVSDFCKSGKWCSFRWVFKNATNWRKVEDGNYDNNPADTGEKVNDIWQ